MRYGYTCIKRKVLKKYPNFYEISSFAMDLNMVNRFAYTLLSPHKVHDTTHKWNKNRQPWKRLNHGTNSLSKFKLQRKFNRNFCTLHMVEGLHIIYDDHNWKIQIVYPILFPLISNLCFVSMHKYIWIKQIPLRSATMQTTIMLRLYPNFNREQ